MDPSTVFAAGAAFGLTAGAWLGAYVTRAELRPPVSAPADQEQLADVVELEPAA